MNTKLEKIKCGNTPNTGITEYIIDDYDDYPEVAQSVSNKKEEANTNTSVNCSTNGHTSGTNGIKNELLLTTN
jgi:hypothetical protein